ncbi:hypothetical protein GF402_06070 [Candidatus Fermentibacteria bacterium]|nr:hypothetical protein [Candidatus Fermentibacteria bacterium]
MRTAALVCATVAAACLAAEMTLSYSLPADLDVRVLESPMGDYFRCGDFPNMGDPRTPSLPVAPLTVLLPTGAVVDSVTLEYVSESLLPGAYEVKPRQPGVPLSRPEDFRPVGRNPDGYAEAEGLPAIQLSGQGTLMGFDVADVFLRPIRWSADTRRATLRNDFRFTLHYHQADEVRIAPRRGTVGTKMVRGLLERSVINPDMVASVLPAPVGSDDLPYGEYLIVAPESMVSNFEPLAEFKTKKGVPASIVTMEYVSGAYSGVDEAQKLRFFLRDIYESSPPTYVLLGGDTDDVPHRECYATAEGYVEYPAADIYYQDMNDTAVGVDSWDHNSNGVWGELEEDLMDYHPDYLIGRASVGSTSDADVFVNKALTYEDGCDSDTWYMSMGFTTGVLWSSPYCPGSAGKEKVDTLYTPEGWYIEKHYDSEGTQSYSLTMDMLNRGMQLVNHAGHGSVGSVSIGNGSLGSSDFHSLTNISNYDRPSIWNTIACLSGSFENDCLAEAWIESDDGGGFCMMNSDYGWGEPSEPGGQWSELVDQEFFAKFFTEDMFYLGEAHAMAKDEFVSLIPSDSHYDWICKALTLFGDPELPMWSITEDGALQVDGPDQLYSGSNTVTVTVSDDSGPVEGARVCFMQGEWDNTVTYEVDYTGSGGQVTMTFNVASTPDYVWMTAWARDHAAVSTQVDVVEGVSDYAQQVGETSLSLPSCCPARSSVSFQWSSVGRPAEIGVYDVSGRLVRTIGRDLTGSGIARWNLNDESGDGVASGIYFVRLSGSDDIVRRLVVAR